MNEKLKDLLVLGIVQFDIEWENPQANRDYLTALLKGDKRKFDVLILPEVFTSGFTNNIEKVAEPMHGATMKWMKQMADVLQCALCGSIFIEENGNFYNRFVWVAPNENPSLYDKRHLFSAERENEKIKHGKALTLIEYKGWKILPQICYDLRFPVWSRNVQKYDLMINVANWPGARRKVWKTLLKARAIENQCYVAGLNRVGSDGAGIEYTGDSMVIDARGIELYSANHVHSVEQVTIDYNVLQNFRKKCNSLNDADRCSLLI